MPLHLDTMAKVPFPRHKGLPMVLGALLVVDYTSDVVLA